MKRPDVILVAGLLALALLSGLTARCAAHGADEHGKKMMKQHRTMARIQVEWDGAREALATGRTHELSVHATALDKAAKGFDSFMLHKNAERRPEFLKRAAEFKRLLKEFRRYAKAKKMRALNRTAPKIEDACIGCHDIFR